MIARPCPKEAPPELLECPRGCGFVTLARPSLRWGPWRLAVHLLIPRCTRPLPGISSTHMTPAELRRHRNNQPRGHHQHGA
uniref:Uncharacterized protein n=1 Tax=Mycobacterium phage JustASigh TaxID=3158894 RepID=A0AAU8GQU1_9CAUD